MYIGFTIPQIYVMSFHIYKKMFSLHVHTVISVQTLISIFYPTLTKGLLKGPVKHILCSKQTLSKEVIMDSGGMKKVSDN